ncbi:MAG: hypothetical protein ABIR19_00965 [Ginsengibacter sp.]
MKYNTATLKKLESILEDSRYIIRYERGSFQSGYCILEEKKVVVLNKFLTTEGRINTIMDLITVINVTYDFLTADSQKMYDMVLSQNKTPQD